MPQIKKKSKILICMIMIAFFAITQLSAQNTGDANGDQDIDIVDALLVAQYYVGLQPSPFFMDQADADCDGTITIVDALTIAQYYVGILDSFNCSITTTAPPENTPTPTGTVNPHENPIACSGYPIWNSQTVYNRTGELVAYNCNLYRNEGFAYNLNPEENNGQYLQWTLIGPCSESDCTMGEGPFIGCGQFDKYKLGEWTIFNNVWGGDPDSQCLTAYSISNWSAVSTQPATSGVKSYPNTGIVDVNKSVGSIKSFTSSFDVTVPSTGDWEVAYDIWVPSEIMLWMYTVGNVGPIASKWNDDGIPVAEAENVSVGGHTWNVYHGGNNVVSFVRTSNTLTGTVDIKAILDWIVDKGWISESGMVRESQFGFEISGTDDKPLTFICNDFTMDVN